MSVERLSMMFLWNKAHPEPVAAPAEALLDRVPIAVPAAFDLNDADDEGVAETTQMWMGGAFEFTRHMDKVVSRLWVSHMAAAAAADGAPAAAAASSSSSSFLSSSSSSSSGGAGAGAGDGAAAVSGDRRKRARVEADVD